jgi:hypothetical protein
MKEIGIENQGGVRHFDADLRRAGRIREEWSRLQAIGRLVNRLTALNFDERPSRLDAIIKLAEAIKEESRRESAVGWLARGYQVLSPDDRIERRVAAIGKLCEPIRNDRLSKIARANVEAARSSSTVYRSVVDVPSVLPEASARRAARFDAQLRLARAGQKPISSFRGKLGTHVAQAARKVKNFLTH